MREPIYINKTQSCDQCEFGVVTASPKDGSKDVYIFKCNRHEVAGRASRYKEWNKELDERLVILKKVKRF
jgi:hypothetical protein